MYKGLRIHALVPCFNEEDRIAAVIQRIRQTNWVDKILVIDDGSTDQTAAIARAAGAAVFTSKTCEGVGSALRSGMRQEAPNCDVLVILAGNNKDEPNELGRLLDPIAMNQADFVQGSRYLSGGGAPGAMPLYRRIATRIHPLIFSLCIGKRVTESTNGFRAFRSTLLTDPRIRLEQKWLNGYGLEPYLYYQVVRLGYRTREVPVTKTYPPRGQRYTKMPMISGWWGILRPPLLLRLGLKR